MYVQIPGMSERASRKRSPTNHFQLEPSCKGSKEKCHLMQESIETEIFRQLKSQNESLLQQMAVVKNQLAHKEAEVRRLNTQLERIDLRKLPASEQENEYEKKSAGWKVKIKKLGEIKDQDSQKIQELTTELDSLRKFWNGMRERVRKAELNLRSSEDKLKASEEKWKNCEKKLESVREELTNDLDQERVLLETLNCELEQKKREFDQLVSNNRYLGRMMEEAEEEKRQAVEENQQMKEEVEGYKGECARLTQICKLNEERINWYAGRLIRAEAVAGRANEQGPTCVKPICVICRFRFGTEGERTPRVLREFNSLD